eukprot:7992646-Alexandrium_andersonii.AAC.1
MSASLVGSEMCIRDRSTPATSTAASSSRRHAEIYGWDTISEKEAWTRTCLLYTSDAADDM